VSAQFYGSFSIGDLLNSVDDSTFILGIIFIVSFALLNLALSRVFRDNKAVPAIIALAVSLFIIWGVNRSGLDYSLFFYDVLFFIPPGILETFLPLILTGLAIFLIFKYGFGVMLLVSGVLLLGTGFLGLVYEVGTVFVTGLILLVVGAYFAWRRAKKKAIGGGIFGSNSSGSSDAFDVGKYYHQGSRNYASGYEKWAKGEKESESFLMTVIKLPFKILFFPIKFLFLPSGGEMRNKADEMAAESARRKEENLRKWEIEKAHEQAIRAEKMNERVKERTQQMYRNQIKRSHEEALKEDKIREEEKKKGKNFFDLRDY